MEQYVCIDIGGTEIKYCIINKEYKLSQTGSTKTNAGRGGKEVLNHVVEIINQLQTGRSVGGACISTAGMVDVKTGTIFHSGPQIPGYAGSKIKETIERACNLPCEVENDVNCAGLAEALLGAGKGKSPCLCLTVGTGVGGCIVMDGKVFRGFSGGACEVGYMHMQGGSFQELAAASVLVHRAGEAVGARLDGRQVFDLAKGGNSVCAAEIERMVSHLAIGIANIVYVLNPEIVLLGGGIMNEHEYLAPMLRRELDGRLVPIIAEKIELAFAKNGNRAGMIGAYLHFLQMRGKSA